MHRDTLAGEHMESLICPNVDDYYEDLDVMNTYPGEGSTQERMMKTSSLNPHESPQTNLKKHKRSTVYTHPSKYYSCLKQLT